MKQVNVASQTLHQAFRVTTESNNHKEYCCLAEIYDTSESGKSESLEWDHAVRLGLRNALTLPLQTIPEPETKLCTDYSKLYYISKTRPFPHDLLLLVSKEQETPQLNTCV